MRKEINQKRSLRRPQSKLIARLKKMTDRLRIRRSKTETPVKTKDEQDLFI